MTTNEEQSILLAMDHDCHAGPEDGCEWCYDIAFGNIRVCGICDGEGYVLDQSGEVSMLFERTEKCEQCLGNGWIKKELKNADIKGK